MALQAPEAPSAKETVREEPDEMEAVMYGWTAFTQEPATPQQIRIKSSPALLTKLLLYGPSSPSQVCPLDTAEFMPVCAPKDESLLASELVKAVERFLFLERVSMSCVWGWFLCATMCIWGLLQRLDVVMLA